MLLKQGAFKLLDDGRILREDREVATPPYYMVYAEDRLQIDALRRVELRLEVECWKGTREGLVHGLRPGWLVGDLSIAFESWHEACTWLHTLRRFPPSPHPRDLWRVLKAVFGLAEQPHIERRGRRGPGNDPSRTYV